MATRENNRLTDAQNRVVARDIRSSLRSLSRRVDRIEAAIGAHLGRHRDPEEDAALLRAIPGAA